MKRIILLLAAAAAAMVLVACGSSDSTTTTSSSSSSSGTTLPSGGNLIGSWLLSCVIDGASSSASIAVTYTATVETFTYNQWNSNSTCAGTSDFTEDGDGTYAFNGTKAISEGTATQVGLVDTRIELTPNTSVGASDLNNENSGAGAYGINNWAMGVTQSIIGVDEVGNAIGTAFKDIFYINSTVTPNTFQFGLEVQDGGSIDTNGYPDSLDPFILLKQ